MNLFRLVRAVLMHRKLSSAFTILSIAAAFAIFTVLSAVSQGLSGQLHFVTAQRLVTNSQISGQRMPLAYASQIASVPGVQAVTYLVQFDGYYQEPSDTLSILAFDAKTILKVYPEFSLPPVERRNFLRDQSGAIAGAALVRRMGWKVGDTIPIQGGPPQRNGSTTWYFHLDGIYHANLPLGYQKFFAVHYEYINQGIALTAFKNTVQQFDEIVSNPMEMSRIASSIDGKFAGGPIRTLTVSEQDQTLSILRQFGDIGAMLTYIGVAVFFSMLLISGNTMANSVRERLSELAVMRALGFGRAQISLLLLLEALVLTGAGTAIGVAAGWLVTRKISPIMVLVLQGFALTWAAIATAVALGLLFTLIIWLLPGRRVARLSIAETLRSG